MSVTVRRDASKSSAAVVTIDAITPAGGSAIPLSAPPPQTHATRSPRSFGRSERAGRSARRWCGIGDTRSVTDRERSGVATVRDDAQLRNEFMSGIPAIELTIDSRVHVTRCAPVRQRAAGAQAIVVDGAPTSFIAQRDGTPRRESGPHRHHAACPRRSRCCRGCPAGRYAHWTRCTGTQPSDVAASVR